MNSCVRAAKWLTWVLAMLVLSPVRAAQQAGQNSAKPLDLTTTLVGGEIQRAIVFNVIWDPDQGLGKAVS